MRARQRYVDLAQEAATPAQRQMSVGLCARDRQGDIIEQRAQQLLAIAIACRGSIPDAFEIFAEGEDRLAFFACERSGATALSIGELSFGGLELLQGAFPLGFEPACDESVLRVHRAFDIVIGASVSACISSQSSAITLKVSALAILTVGRCALGSIPRARSCRASCSCSRAYCSVTSGYTPSEIPRSRPSDLYLNPAL